VLVVILTKVPKSTPSSSATLSKDISLLKEYGFRGRTLKSASLNLKKIDNFGMRQLDRLKLLLLRNEVLVGAYPPGLRSRIMVNDLESFATALALLSPFLVKEWELTEGA
jgi:hypothetical protein